MTGRVRIRLALPVLWIALLLFSAASSTAGAAPAETIQDKVTQYIERTGIGSAVWGIEIIDPAHHEVVISLNSDKSFLPASVIKIITTAAALEKLGPDFRFRTGVYTDGRLQPEGILDGNLILLGRGDPNLFDRSGELIEKPALLGLAEKLALLGIQRIGGDVVGDDSYFEFTTHGKGWTDKDLRSAYGAPINALSIHNNIVGVYARPGKVNQLVRISIWPPTSYFNIRNVGMTAKAGTRRTLFARMVSGTNNLVISGELPSSRRYSQYVILERPAEFAATLFKEELGKQGIRVDGKVREIHFADLPPEVRRKWICLTEHESAPLIDALEKINKQSENLHAEMLLRVMGAELKGSGTDDAGLEVLRDFLVEAGIASDTISLTDGSGLSRHNLMTPRLLTALLLYVSTRPYADIFRDTLAVSGTDGTLKRRLRTRPVKGLIQAKTGSLKGVATMSGYMTTLSGRNLIFTIFVNNARTSISRLRRAIDEICTLVVRQY
jgi:D-alanyl-D-alanine carboxypeptidase/D-alanyl-D-alanine-endopeptidase (penicillin-binding protein 4)